jgi:hypothetical protein
MLSGLPNLCGPRTVRFCGADGPQAL